MSTTEIILIIVAFIALGFSLYKKYISKDQGKSSQNRQKSGSSFSSFSDDGYEPYSKNRDKE